MKKLIVVGSGGRLGAALERAYRHDYEVTGFSRQQLDLGVPKQIHEALDSLEFDVLINSAALTNVDYCETHPEEAFQVNATAAGQIAKICEKKSARMLHISTDYVFDGNKTVPYTEEDKTNPVSIYGRSKEQGETEVLGVSGNNLVARVSWVFGPDRPSFLDSILQRARESEAVGAIGDKYSVPTFTLDAVEYLKPFLENGTPGGLLHLCNSGSCSWQEYGQYALDCAVRAGITLKANTVGFQKLSEMKAFVAQRPVYTVLSNDKLTAILGVKPRSWQDAVEDYIRSYIPKD